MNHFSNNKKEAIKLQNKFNKENEEFNSSLPKKDKKKIEAVEEAINILNKNNVTFIGFFYTKHRNSPEEEVAVQYNNFAESSKFNNEKLSKLNCLFAVGIWNHIANWILFNKLEKQDKQKWFDMFMQSHISRLQEINDQVELPPKGGSESNSGAVGG